MSYDILRDSLYSKDSNTHWCSVLRQQKFLKEIIERLTKNNDSDEEIINEALESLKYLTQKPWLHIATDLERYKLSAEPWKKYATNGEAPKE